MHACITCMHLPVLYISASGILPSRQLTPQHDRLGWVMCLWWNMSCNENCCLSWSFTSALLGIMCSYLLKSSTMSMQYSTQSWLASDVSDLCCLELLMFRLLAWFMFKFSSFQLPICSVMCFRRKAPMEQSWDTQEWQMSYVRRFRQMASKAFIEWAAPSCQLLHPLITAVLALLGEGFPALR